MKIVVFGAHGFIGKAVGHELSGAAHAVLDGTDLQTRQKVDLRDQDALERYISDVKPDAVINCAGVVGGVDSDFENNMRFTGNILLAIAATKTPVKRVIISGSAGEYGQVETVPVAETAQLNGNNPYALSKVNEEHLAHKLGQEHGIPVVVVRVFNPLGVGMKEKFLIPALLRQISDVRDGKAGSIDISRLDALRDYVAVSDIAIAYKLLIEGNPAHSVYNIGSGVSTSNKQILDLLLKNSKLLDRPEIVETVPNPEPLAACQADISRIREEFGWQPRKSIEEIIMEVVDAEN